MAKLRVSEALLCELLLPGVQMAGISKVEQLPNGDFDITCSGIDVPEGRAAAVVQLDWERATPAPKRTLTFQGE